MTGRIDNTTTDLALALNKAVAQASGKDKDSILIEYKCESECAIFATIDKENFDLFFEKFEGRRINDLSEFLQKLPFFET